MFYGKETLTKEAGNYVQVWDECLLEMQVPTKEKLRIVYLLMFLISVLIGIGFYLLYPFERKSTYLMVVGDPDYGSFLVEQSLSQYQADLEERYPSHNDADKKTEKTQVGEPEKGSIPVVKTK